MTQEELDRQHESAFRALQEVDRIFKKHNLAYLLLAGTVLGAVRHGGFIPWDDDIDVAIYRKDIRRAGKLLTRELSEEFAYVDCYNDPTFPRMFGKVISKETGRVQVDLFPLVKTAEEARGRQRQWRAKILINYLYYGKLNYINPKYKGKPKYELIRVAGRILSAGLSREAIIKMARRNEARYEGLAENTNFLVLYGSHHLENEMIRREWIGKSSEILFNGQPFPTVEQVDAYLTNMYGDYMTPPDAADRALRHEEAFTSSH